MLSKTEKINKLYNESIRNSVFLNLDGIPEVKREFDIDKYTDLVIAEVLKYQIEARKLNGYTSRDTNIFDPAMKAFGFDIQDFLLRFGR
jgi:hypothetical protein